MGSNWRHVQWVSHVPADRANSYVRPTQGSRDQRVGRYDTGLGHGDQGDPIGFTAQSGIYLWSGEAGYHYDAVQITDNATGQSVWAVGSGNTDRTQMAAASGGGVGTYTDYPQSGGTGTLPEYPTTNLQPGTYTAKFWVADGVDRISATPATTTFTIAPASATPTPPPPTPTPSGRASITLSPATNQSVASGTQETIQYTTTNFQPGDHVEIVPSGSNTSYTWSTNGDTNSTDTFNETENPQNGSSSQVQYTAYLYNSAGTVIDTAQSGQITWTSSIPATTSL